MALAAERIHQDPYAGERRLFRRWSTHVDSLDHVTACDDCGLTPHLSTPSTMERVFVMGERERDDAGGYDVNDPPPEPDYEVLQVTEFMEFASVLIPFPYKALLARHRRLVRGVRHDRTPEPILANLLYKSGYRSLHQLREDCDAGYAAARRWLIIWRQREGLVNLKEVNV